mmetsp:Transcript_19309/g.54355  ORF Transcript_19309/g.54355 Transcript_19309/m.54355 type:complete len:385 (+) Transcript_19309:3-1157(+)
MVDRSRKVDGVATSLCDLGYCDVGLDDAWQACGEGAKGYWYHDAEGRPKVDTSKFPDLRAMTSKAHRLGLGAGWYANNCICMEQRNATPAMYEQDVSLFTEAQFDSIKIDGCGTQRDVDMWMRLFESSGRKVTVENCHWGLTVPTETWCPWHMYRTSYDIRPSYGIVVRNLLSTVHFAKSGLSRPGCWAYPDMLELGSPWDDAKLTLTESRSHFGAWCIVSSPLTLSHDVQDDAVMDELWPIIANKEAIEINQAWAGHSGSPFKESTANVTIEGQEMPAWQYFYKPIGGGRVAVLMMNHGKAEQRLSLDARDVPGLECGGGHCSWRDVWARKDLPKVRGVFSTTLPSHDSAFLVLAPSQASHGALRATPRVRGKRAPAATLGVV